jgi:hypothetical protein
VPSPPAPSAPEVAAAPVAAPSSPGGSTVIIDRDSLSQAWGDGILRGLPARVKALYSAGRFVAADPTGAQFALPNVAHRDRCVELAPQVESALAQHFGSPVRLVLVVDGGTGEPPPPTAAPPGDPSSPTPQGDPVEADEIDPEELRHATAADTDHALAAEARLLEAFPGASEVAE